MNHRRLFATLVLVALLGACGSDSRSTSPTTPPTSPGTTPGTSPGSTTPGTPASDSKGWVDGEPQWTADPGEASVSAGADTDRPATDGAAMTAASESGDVAPPSPLPPGDERNPPDTSPLRAGNVDDNADFAAFVDYLARIADLGIATRQFDPSGRIVVSVIRPDGLPAAGVEVAVTGSDGAAVATIRSTADGSARFLPALYGPIQTTYRFAALGVEATAAPDGSAQLMVQPPTAPAGSVALDVLFLLDATGSMGDEIDRLKTTIDSVAGRLAGLDTQPDFRFGMTLYRDLDDSFVTSTYDFTGSLDDFRSALANVVAEGGGDYPEALDEGLAEALGTPTWRDPSSTVQLVFLVADAPPQVGRQVETSYTQSIAEAISRGIKIIPIASSESDDQAEAVFRQLAAATGARFVFLASGAGGAATGPSTDIDSTDYEELALDDLIVRLVSEELAALTGVEPADTTTSTDQTTPPTNPDGQ